MFFLLFSVCLILGHSFLLFILSLSYPVPLLLLSLCLFLSSSLFLECPLPLNAYSISTYRHTHTHTHTHTHIYTHTLLLQTRLIYYLRIFSKHQMRATHLSGCQGYASGSAVATTGRQSSGTGDSRVW